MHFFHFFITKSILFGSMKTILLHIDRYQQKYLDGKLWVQYWYKNYNNNIKLLNCHTSVCLFALIVFLFFLNILNVINKIIFFILSTAELFWHSKLGLTTFKSCQMILRRTKVWSGLKLLETLQAVWLAVSALFYEFNCFTVGIDSSQKIVQPWAQWLKPIFFNQFDSVKIGRCSVFVSCYDFFFDLYWLYASQLIFQLQVFDALYFSTSVMQNCEDKIIRKFNLCIAIFLENTTIKYWRRTTAIV